MIRKFFLVIGLLLAFHCADLRAQNDSLAIDKNTKFGLALSGGGAKGFAHIGILKLIDSLGIKIDYITGTSMGGILGGLYAMGYSGEDLKKIICETNWDRVLSNKIPYSKVSIEEKDEYDKYIIEFPVDGGIPTLPSSFIEGQYMSEVLNTVTFPAKHINDFSRLKIPVALTSSDIVNGGLVMQRKGSLPLAIRATLAIPAVFSPVYIDGKLLVDGGLDRNFPVSEVAEMGAGYIIGGYTGFRLFTKKEIENPMKMIYQTHAFNSVKTFRNQSKLTNILVDFIKPLGSYTTKDFKHYKKIIAIGEEEVQKHLPELAALAKKQRELGIQYNHSLIKEVKKPTIRINYFEDNGDAITNNSEIQSIRSLLNLKEGQYHDVKAANAAIDRVFGTRMYDRVYYTYTDAADGLIMNIFVKRSKAGSFKLAMHYDNEQSVGIIVNYTYRNLLLSKSRLAATVDIAERFKARVSYQKFIDNSNKVSVYSEAKFINLRSNDILFKEIGRIDNHLIPNYRYSNFTANLGVKYILNAQSVFHTGIEHNLEFINKEVDRLTQGDLDNYQRRVFNHSNQYVFLRYLQNSLNTKYYYRSGNSLHIGARFYFNNQHKIYFPRDNSVSNISSELYDYLNPESPGYSKVKHLIGLYVNENFAVPLNKYFSVKLNGFLGQQFSFDRNPQNPYVYFNQKFNAGGSEYNFDGMSPEFNGLRQKEVPLNSVAKLGVELQYNPVKNAYLSPSLHVANMSNGLQPFSTESFTAVGYGINLGYASILGPLNFNISKNNLVDLWRYYFSIGFKF